MTVTAEVKPQIAVEVQGPSALCSALALHPVESDASKYVHQRAKGLHEAAGNKPAVANAIQALFDLDHFRSTPLDDVAEMGTIHGRAAELTFDAKSGVPVRVEDVPSDELRGTEYRTGMGRGTGSSDRKSFRPSAGSRRATWSFTSARTAQEMADAIRAEIAADPRDDRSTRRTIVVHFTGHTASADGDAWGQSLSRGRFRRPSRRRPHVHAVRHPRSWTTSFSCMTQLLLNIARSSASARAPTNSRSYPLRSVGCERSSHRSAPQALEMQALNTTTCATMSQR